MATLVPDFERIDQKNRDKLLRHFSGRENLAREFWDEVANEVEMCDMLGVTDDLKTKRSGPKASEIKASMEVIYNAARVLIQKLDDGTCIRLASPPDGRRYNSQDRKARQGELTLLKHLLADLVKDADPDNGWGVDHRVSLRLDYILASKIQSEVECADVSLSAPALVDVVFSILGIQTDSKDAIKGAQRTFS